MNKIDINDSGAPSQGIQPGRYRHYKGGEYQVIDTAIHSETEELLVLYRPLYGEKSHEEQKMWVRPFDMFVGSLVVDGQEVPRFKYVGKV
jgi:hypothetical protein